MRISIFDRFKMKNARRVDALVAEIHAEAFQKINCLDCANCCKTLGTLVTKADAIRISDFWKYRLRNFMRFIWKKDEEGDLIIKTLPCSFLAEDNTCKIYSVRPKECKEYPHTHKKDLPAEDLCIAKIPLPALRYSTL